MKLQRRFDCGVSHGRFIAKVGICAFGMLFAPMARGEGSAPVRTWETVNLLGGKYQDQAEDIFVKVLGHRIGLTRQYLDGAWRFPTNVNLGFNYEVASGSVSQLVSIVAGGDLFSKEDDQGTVFAYGGRTIYARTNGFWMVDVLGNWRSYDGAGKLLRYGDPNERTVQAQFDGQGRLTGYLDHFSNQVLWIAYANSRIASVSDQAGGGRIARFFYDANGNLTNAVDVRGYKTEYGYDATNRLILKREPNGREIHVAYHADGSVASVTDQDGAVTSFTYDYDQTRKEYYALVLTPSGNAVESGYNSSGSGIYRGVNGDTVFPPPDDDATNAVPDPVVEKDASGNVVGIQYPDGSSTSFEYDSADRLIREVDELGAVTRYAYDARGNPIQVVLAAETPLEQVRECFCDIFGNPTSLVWRGDAQVPDAVIHISYDERGNVTSMRDPEGHERHRTYDIMGNVLVETDELGYSVTNRYDAAGHLLETTDPLGGLRRVIAYDAAGNPIHELASDGTEWFRRYDYSGRMVQISNSWGYGVDRQYDLDGNLIRTEDSDGKTATYEYDDEKRMVRKVDETGSEYRYAYDGWGRKVHTVGPDGNVTTIEYDSDNNKVAIRHPTYEQRYEYDRRGRKTCEAIVKGGVTNATTYGYDAAGNLTLVIDAEGGQTKYVYDLLGRRTMMIDARGATNRYGYDVQNNMVWIEDGNGNRTRAEYDRNTRWTRMIYPDGATVQSIYDAGGNRVKRIDPNGQWIEHDYDGLRRITQSRLFNAGGMPVKTNAYAYDAASRLSGWTDGAVSGSIAYDAANRTIVDTVDFGTFTAAQSFVFDAWKRLVGYAGPDGLTNRYSMGADGQIGMVDLPGQGTVTFERNRDASLSKIVLPGGSVQEILYDDFSRERSETLSDPAGTPLLAREYVRDRAGSIVRIATGSGELGYAYDPGRQLVSESHPALGEKHYAYDGAGNRLGDGASTNAWEYNQMNQLVKAGDRQYEYDANGNAVRESISNAVYRNYEYDVQNQLVVVRDGAGTVLARYGYDPFGRRIMKTTGGQTNWYVYADEGLAAEFSGQGQLIRSYGHVPGAEWGSRPLHMKTGGKYYYYVNDRQGTPLALIESSGAIAWTADYEAFGKAQAGGGVQNFLRGSAQYEDPETGFHYNTFRYYHPALGRYVQRDPLEASKERGVYIWRADSNPLLIMDDPNSYRYVRNSPLNMVDFLGLFSEGYKEGGTYSGHGDFVGYGKTCGTHDYNLEDDDPATSPVPTWDPKSWMFYSKGLPNHFKSKDQVTPDLDKAINQCQKEAFDRFMHQYQDTYVHFEKGYTAEWFGHGWDSFVHWATMGILGANPDKDETAWGMANEDTDVYLAAWEANCCWACTAADGCLWVLKGEAGKYGGCQ